MKRKMLKVRAKELEKSEKKQSRENVKSVPTYTINIYTITMQKLQLQTKTVHIFVVFSRRF